MMEISCFVEPAKVPLPATSITPFFPGNTIHFTATSALLFYSPLKATASLRFLPAGARSYTPACISAALLAWISAEPPGRPLARPQGCGRSPGLGALLPAGLAGADPAGTHRQGCCRARSHWKVDRLPALGVQGVLRAGWQLRISSTERRGREALSACKLCSQGFGDLLLSPGV